MDIIGFRTVGINAGSVGTMSGAIGSAEFPIEWLKELRRGLKDAPQFFCGPRFVRDVCVDLMP
jgi:hypothetical protein